MIFWVGPLDEVVRPTDPFDPELPVWAFRRKDGTFEAVMFNHSTHTIGVHKPGVRSPAFYGLAAQGLEKEKGGTFLFFEGASGSTHNLDLAGPEMTLRITEAVKDALKLPRSPARSGASRGSAASSPSRSGTSTRPRTTRPWSTTRPSR